MNIAGKNIQVDLSGIGTYWNDATAENLPADVQNEIEAEIIDGNVSENSCYVASNGIHYRW